VYRKVVSKSQSDITVIEEQTIMSILKAFTGIVRSRLRTQVIHRSIQRVLTSQLSSTLQSITSQSHRHVSTSAFAAAAAAALNKPDVVVRRVPLTTLSGSFWSLHRPAVNADCQTRHMATSENRTSVYAASSERNMFRAPVPEDEEIEQERPSSKSGSGSGGGGMMDDSVYREAASQQNPQITLDIKAYYVA
jgi:hypothetical protein